MSPPTPAHEQIVATMAYLQQKPDQSSSEAQRLQLLLKSLSGLVQEMEQVLDESGNASTQASSQNFETPSVRQPSPAELALAAYRERRRRAEIFGDESLFGEPAWDMLLDLFVAGVKNKRVAVTSACIGSGVPSTTALRWLNVLESHGLVEREEDNSDARRSFVRLTTKARTLMTEYFSGHHE